MANLDHLATLKLGVNSWNLWRREHPAVTPDLSGAELLQADLRLVDLHAANLSSADLRASVLSGAVLSEANLREARLEGATLCDATLCIDTVDLYGVDPEERGAEIRRAAGSAEFLIRGKVGYHFGPEVQGFQRTNLCDSILEAADLSRAVMTGVSLKRADLARAVFEGTVLHCDLSEVRGLDDTKHRGPSHITTAALASLTVPQPERFLRGIGLQDWQIREARFRQSSDYYSCFISYNHTDANFVRQLHDRLQNRGIRCWLDEHQMLPGDDIYEQVARGIKLWDKTLLCCSRSSLTSWWVDHEIDSAFQKERGLMAERGKKIFALIPINLDGYLFSDAFESGKKQQLLSRLAANFVGWESDTAQFDNAVEKLVKALRPAAHEGDSPPTPKL